MSKETVYWKQKDGKLMSIDDMDINHLRNVLKMIVKNSNKHKKTQLLMEISPEKSFEEIQLNGDMANEFNNTDIDHHEFESDLGYNFNDDECRGNQW
jgi:ABC-type histidine transport system ATPase subunit